MDMLLSLISKNGDSIVMKYVCETNYSYTNARYNTYNWKIIISGTGTYENRHIIKSAGAHWDKINKVWIKYIKKEEVPLAEIELQRENEIKHYHDKNLTFPWCKPKCSRINK